MIRDGDVVEADCGLCHVPSNRVLWASRHVSICRPTGGLVPGHVLIIARSHGGSFASAEPTVHRALKVARRVAVAELERDYGQCVLMFEHGLSQPRPGSEAHCLHPHLNIVPSNRARACIDGVANVMGTLGAPMRRLDHATFDAIYASAPHEYYALGDHEACHYLATPAAAAPPRRRAFRIALADVLGLDRNDAANWEQSSVEGPSL